MGFPEPLNTWSRWVPSTPPSAYVPWYPPRLWQMSPGLLWEQGGFDNTLQFSAWTEFGVASVSCDHSSWAASAAASECRPSYCSRPLRPDVDGVTVGLRPTKTQPLIINCAARWQKQHDALPLSGPHADVNSSASRRLFLTAEGKWGN